MGRQPEGNRAGAGRCGGGWVGGWGRARGGCRWEKMEAMGEELCVRTAHETDFGPVVQIDGELVLDNPALDHL